MTCITLVLLIIAQRWNRREEERKKITMNWCHSMTKFFSINYNWQWPLSSPVFNIHHYNFSDRILDKFQFSILHQIFVVNQQKRKGKERKKKKHHRKNESSMLLLTGKIVNIQTSSFSQCLEKQMLSHYRERERENWIVTFTQMSWSNNFLSFFSIEYLMI